VHKAVFLLVFFSNLFAINAKPSVGSLPFMLNLLWDDRHLSHIKKMGKKKHWDSHTEHSWEHKSMPNGSNKFGLSVLFGWRCTEEEHSESSLGLVKLQHSHSSLQRICARKSLFLSNKWLSHWPTTMIGPGSES
jgi:hypothetical protein